MALMLGSTSSACTEQELIAAARDGDDRAFEELYARFGQRIALFIRGRIRDHGRAEDVAQEVFIAALRRLRASEQAIAFKPWIYEIAKNACIDEHRRSQRIREVSLEASAELNGDPGSLRSIAPTPPAAMESKQQLEDLRGAFGGLSDSHHRLLVMREFEGRSYDEIAQHTGMSRQMVESALFRARRKLGAEYEELASGRRCRHVQTAIEAGKLTSRRSLGVRERRQLARHLAHCQPCRIKARLAGADDAFARPGIAAKIAGLLPFPIWRWWPFGRVARVAARTSSHPGLQAAGAAVEPGASSLLTGAAVAVAALAIAGSGVSVAPPRHAVHPALARDLTSAAVSPSGPPAPALEPSLPAGSAGAAGPTLTKPAGQLSGLAAIAASRTRRLSSSRRARAAVPPSSSAGYPASPGLPTGQLPLSSPTGTGSGSSAVGSVTRSANAPLNQAGQSASSTVGALGENPVLKRIGRTLPAVPFLGERRRRAGSDTGLGAAVSRTLSGPDEPSR